MATSLSIEEAIATAASGAVCPAGPNLVHSVIGACTASVFGNARGPTTTHMVSRLLRLRKAVTDLMATAPDIVLHPEVERAVEQELARAMIACFADPGTAETQRPSQRRLSVMARFEETLRVRPVEPLCVTDICAGWYWRQRLR